MCFKLNGFTDTDRAKAIRRMSEVCVCVYVRLVDGLVCMCVCVCVSLTLIDHINR